MSKAACCHKRMTKASHGKQWDAFAYLQFFLREIKALS
jgi:hypothetical protein